jgi:hypothetical protein
VDSDTKFNLLLLKLDCIMLQNDLYYLRTKRSTDYMYDHFTEDRQGVELYYRLQELLAREKELRAQL